MATEKAWGILPMMVRPILASGSAGCLLFLIYYSSCDSVMVAQKSILFTPFFLWDHILCKKVRTPDVALRLDANNMSPHALTLYRAARRPNQNRNPVLLGNNEKYRSVNEQYQAIPSKTGVLLGIDLDRLVFLVIAEQYRAKPSNTPVYTNQTIHSNIGSGLSGRAVKSKNTWRHVIGVRM
ncbi:hypothetical protein KFK09_005110 [Dendrobium nobile]|uniref:Uncharacterized protein n=1 Tax=Dendrobium nobile TaxID=94219 RepID=A0A8T3C026_DENNO|nr:hypothetical protein KFK09_005110 [Dendrobium nobile]